MDRLLPAASRIAEILKAREQTLAVSESAAGGLISAALLAVPGASAFYLGGGVIYTRPARRALLGLSDREVKAKGATESYALVAARTIRERLEADWAIGESGVAGPTGSRYGHPPGHAGIAVAGPVELAETVQTGLDDRVENMRLFGIAALDLLERVLRQD
ncbi:CinA family protein [Marinibaculum pumilum]|uniref:CinA family protein n=1 Tax=Marinibaculum pumilum TaxID=1766165 RepID=A0ABV7KW35_9PROT